MHDAQPRTNLPALIALVIIALAIVLVIFSIIWWTESPFVHPASESYPTVAEAVRTTDVAPGTEAAEEHLVITVTMKDGRPTATYTLPPGGTWGAPPFRFEQDPEKKSWSLVAYPPAVKEIHKKEVRSLPSAWSRVLSEDQESSGGETDRAEGSRYKVAIPSATIRMKTGTTLKPPEYKRRRTDELVKSAASLANLAKQEKARNEFITEITRLLPTALKVFENVSGNSEENRKKLELLAEAGHLYLCRELGDDQGKPETLDTFYFNASSLRWTGSLPYRRNQSVSPVVEVRMVRGTSGFEFESAYLDLSGDPTKESGAIAQFQLKTAAQFLAQPQTNTWPAVEWLTYADEGSLNAMSFIGIVQSLRAAMNRDRQNQPPPLVESLAKGINESNAARMRNTMNSIAGSKSFAYHNTYLYCEYVVAVVHLRALLDDVPSGQSIGYNRQLLTDLILDGADRIAKNVMSDGRFSRYLSRPADLNDADRSVAQVGLYTLQYVQLHSDKDEQKDPRSINARDALRRLANALGQFRQGVKYDDKDASYHPPLYPAHFQASIAKLQLFRLSTNEPAGITLDEFQKDLNQIDAVFTSSLVLDNRPVYQAYQLMYWSRVYELLESLRLNGDDRIKRYFVNADPAMFKLRTMLQGRFGFYSLQDALPNWEFWSPVQNVSLRNGDPPSQAQQIMIVIAMESLRTAYDIAGRRQH